ncbi:Spy0128 family protein [Streptococcus sp. zg-JUN1979]|uniref:DUF7601 domain-containing protein n=1 Tax=Streptococcus sp. zg-JUN1979 TaxID=3391450 RepID=UPI0039A58957
MNMSTSQLIKRTSAGLMTAAAVLAMATASPAVLAEVKHDAVEITKTLNAAEGVTLPSATFSFYFTGVGTASVPLTDYPDLSPVSVSFTGADTETDYQTGAVSKITEDIFKDVDFTRTGEYVYKVKEVTDKTTDSQLNSGFTPNDPSDSSTGTYTDKMIWDETTYEMHVIVKDDGDGKYISSVYFTKEGETEKVDSLSFSNTYIKEAGKNPGANNELSSFDISKVVTGEFADKSKDFSFSLTFTTPSNESVREAIAGTYTAQVKTKDAAGNTIDVADKVYQLTLDKDTKTVTLDFTLKAGEFLDFASLPSGLRYTLVEDGTINYLPSALVVENSETNSANEYKGTLSQTLELTNNKGGFLIGQHDNSVAVTNAYEDNNVTATGFLVKNLPFAVMIVLGATAFIVFAKKKRNR